MGKRELVDIACRVVQERELSIAIADGTTEEIKDERTGELKEREKWFWLPRSQVEVNNDGTVTMPEWLAEEKELI